MIKVGDFLVCKEDYIFEDYTYLIKDRPYKVESRYLSTISVSAGIWFCLDERKMGAYVWDWFYMPAEWRDRQIDKILEDD